MVVVGSYGVLRCLAMLEGGVCQYDSDGEGTGRPGGMRDRPSIVWEDVRLLCSTSISKPEDL